MTEITILGVSHHKRETKEFFKLREEGLPAYNFICFDKPVIIVLEGIEYVTDENACIFYTPGYRQEYRAYKEDFANDFITFETSVADFAQRFVLPENEIFYICEADRVSRKIEWITWAVTNKVEQHNEDIGEAVIDLFATVSKLRIENHPELKRIHETKRRFAKLRGKMRANPKDWTIEKMSQEVWLTRSRFSVLYREYFGISPNADLVDMRIEYAKNLLISTDEPILDIANACGYQNISYFIRMFNKHVKKTPLQYRKAYFGLSDKS